MIFWQGKRVLLTGHTGFKGSWLALWLQLLGAEVIGYALEPPTTPNLFSVASLEEGMVSILGDICDFASLKKTIHHYQPEIVFHLAAQPLVRHAYRNPIETYTTNVLGTVHLFEALRLTGCARVIINVTTDKCYDNKEWHWGYRESDRLGGHDPYSNSKACSELVTQAYRDSYFNAMNVGLASARAGNVIGGGDWASDRLIPDIIRACLSNEPVAIRRPYALRPWQHVLEPLSGYLLLAECLYHSPEELSDCWNFGPNEDDVKPVSFLVDYLSERLGNTYYMEDGTKHPHEATYLKLDCAKAKSRLGWQPHWHLTKGLEETIRWYQAFEAGDDMRAFTLAQITHFINQEKHNREQYDVNTTLYSCSLR